MAQGRRLVGHGSASLRRWTASSIYSSLYLRLTTVGRRSGKQRSAILGYVEDGPNLVTLAMNGWLAPEPASWLNLQGQLEAVIELRDGSRPIRARTAEGEERARLWAMWKTFGASDATAARRPLPTAAVVLEPRD